MPLAALLWFLGSAVVGYLGRAKSVGFSGFFVFSLIFSPVVGALSLFVAGPSAAERRREIQARALVRLAAVSRPEATVRQATIRSITLTGQATMPPGAALQAFVLPWLALVLVFAVAYWAMGTRTAITISSALALSLDVATFGMNPGAATGLGVPLSALDLAMGIERGLLICLLVILLYRLVATQSDRLASDVRAAAEQQRAAMATLDTSLHEAAALSRRSLESLAVLHAAAATPAATEAAAVMEHAATR
jgi:hypothetical protein